MSQKVSKSLSDAVVSDKSPVTDIPAPPSSAIRKNLELTRSKRTRWIWRIVILAVVAGAVTAGIIVWRKRAAAEGAPRYLTEETRRGDLRVTVSATGNLQGRDTVEIGAEISGRIKTVKVDFNDRVTKDQVIAEIATDQIDATVEQRNAQLKNTQAQVVSAVATAKEAKLQAERNKDMASKGLVSQQQLESSQAASERADAAVGAARAQATVAGASLKEAQTNLGKAIIRSPIDGVVLARHIEVGQTVAASLQAPILFTIARDLKEMVLEVDIDEADIGKVKEGQSASFTVDAYPGRRFRAQVESVHNVPKTTEQASATVVTYQANLAVKNEDLVLRPGMTATATIVTAEKKDVLLVPNAALRFVPPSASAEASSRGGRGGLPLPGFGGPPGMRGGGRPRGAASGSAGPPRRGPGGTRERVFVLDGNSPKPVMITIGATDGVVTEVVQGELDEGTALVIDVATEEK